ncbi:MAG TPA: hypothetical protein VEP73_03000 [Actinomycetota bacterium]|nr:hypothetical protein [Actinomycetota bacterium]
MRTIAHFWPITRAHIYAELGQEVRRHSLLLKVFFGERIPPERLAGLLAEERARLEANRDCYAATVDEVEPLVAASVAADVPADRSR